MSQLTVLAIVYFSSIVGVGLLSDIPTAVVQLQS